MIDNFSDYQFNGKTMQEIIAITTYWILIAGLISMMLG